MLVMMIVIVSVIVMVMGMVLAMIIMSRDEFCLMIKKHNKHAVNFNHNRCQNTVDGDGCHGGSYVTVDDDVGYRPYGSAMITVMTG